MPDVEKVTAPVKRLRVFRYDWFFELPTLNSNLIDGSLWYLEVFTLKEEIIRQRVHFLKLEFAKVQFWNFTTFFRIRIFDKNKENLKISWPFRYFLKNTIPLFAHGKNN